MVEVTKPEPSQTICDPACGTGGFFLASFSYLSNSYKLNKIQKEFLVSKTFKGWDIVDNVVRLCVMNLFLHGLNSDENIIITGDSLLMLQQ